LFHSTQFDHHRIDSKTKAAIKIDETGSVSCKETTSNSTHYMNYQIDNGLLSQQEDK